MLVGRILVQVLEEMEKAEDRTTKEGQGGSGYCHSQPYYHCDRDIVRASHSDAFHDRVSVSAGPVARLSRPFRVEIDLRGRLLVIDDARERGSLRLVDANLIPPEVLLQHLGFWV